MATGHRIICKSAQPPLSPINITFAEENVIRVAIIRSAMNEKTSQSEEDQFGLFDNQKNSRLESTHPKQLR